MPAPSPDLFDPLSTEDLRRVDAICLRFERCWCENPCLENFFVEGELDAFANPNQSKEALFWELLRVEIEYRLKKGEMPKIAEYLQRFPDQADTIKAVFAGFVAANTITTIAGESQESDPDTTIDFSPAEGSPNLPAVPPSDLFPAPFGEYILLEYIDGAGQGIIYKAKPIVGDDFVVALKCIKMGVLASQDQVQRFKIEAQALAQMENPHIIPIYHVGEFKGQYFFTMQLIEGGSLKDKLDELQKDPRATARLVAKVAHAIHHAHQRGILHRDLKPGNILLNAKGDPVVIDFGLAKRLQGETGEQHVICGTINYMPPEQAEGSESLTTAVDIYSLGAVLYHCLTGRPPYQATTFEEFRRQVRNDNPPSPTSLNPAIPKKLETICLHCLEKDPDRRYETAEELEQDLNNWLADEPVSVCPENVGQRVLRWARKKPYIATLTTVLILSLVIGTAMVWYFAIVATREAAAKTQALQKAEWRQYRSQIDLIHRELLGGNDVSAKEHLETCPPTHQDWEYHYLLGLYQRTKPRELIHNNEKIVWNLALNPKNPKQLATVTAKGTLSVWTLTEPPKVIASVSAHKKYVWEVKWSSDGKYIATAGEDQTAKVWDASSLKLLATLCDIAKSPGAGALKPTLKEVWSVGFSPKSDKLLTGCEDGTVVVWKLQPDEKSSKLTVTPEKVLPHQPGVWAIESTKDGNFLGTASGAHQRGFIVSKPGEVRIYDPTTWRIVQTLRDHKNACTSATFSPNGGWLVTGGYDNMIHVYRANGIFKEQYAVRGHTDRRIIGALFTPNGKYFATGSWDKTVRLWDRKTGQLVRQFLGHRGPISGLAFSPDSRFLYTASGDIKKTGIVRIWDWNIQRHAYSSLKHHSKEVSEVAFSPSKQKPLLATASQDGTIKLCDPQKGTVLRTLPLNGKNISPINCIAFEPIDGNYLISGHQDGTTKLWNVKSGELLHTFDPPKKLPVLSVCFSPDGQRIASGYGKRDREVTDGSQEKVGQKYGHAQVWNWRKRELLHSKSNDQDSVFSVIFSRDGTALIRASGVFDQESRNYISACVRSDVVVTGTTTRWAAMSEGHQNKIECVRYSPDRKLMATASSDQTIRFWKGQKAGPTLRGHTADVFSIAFSPSGKRLASASSDHTVRLWDVSRGQEILRFELSDECKSLAFSPDGRYLAAALVDGTVRVYGLQRK